MSTKRRIWLYTTIWLGIGLLVFGTIARRIRIKRQNVWFDDASRGMEKGELPGSPLGLKLLVTAILVSLATTIYMYLSLVFVGR